MPNLGNRSKGDHKPNLIGDFRTFLLKAKKKPLKLLLPFSAKNKNSLCRFFTINLIHGYPEHDSSHGVPYVVEVFDLGDVEDVVECRR